MEPPICCRIGGRWRRPESWRGSASPCEHRHPHRHAVGHLVGARDGVELQRRAAQVARQLRAQQRRDGATQPHHLDDAIAFANNSEFGLGASLWTRRDDVDPLVARIESGHVAVNGIVKSDPRLPFGGIKDSGYGRELSQHGIWEFVNRKTAWIA